ncbi:MBL fold metallo-hydrolase [Permianibacter sp. IMCC34836]|nr:MBL fold metallo-hydrolase [Permianibacter fluminis]
MQPEVRCWGGVGEVTGSCYQVTLGKESILLDCGLLQGGAREDARNYEPTPYDPRAIDAVVLSHSHLDHAGRLPKLQKEGYRGPIYTHRASRDLCSIMLRDAAHLQEADQEVENRKRARKGLKPREPLYTHRDVERVMKQFEVLDYGEWQPLTEHMSVRLHDAGHILGSSIVELKIAAPDRDRILIFSGDLGPFGAPILRNPELIPFADALLMESTYGDRDHRDFDSTLTELGEIFRSEQSQKGNILIPAFAVGRSQELLYLMAKYYREWGLSRWQIFLDSPLAIDATNIYLRHHALYNGDAVKLLGNDHPEHALRRLLPNLQFLPTPEQSQSLNRVQSGAIIIAGSGMCTGGRIKHHLKHLVWRDTTQVIMIGYQAYGTPGLALVEGRDFIRLWGEGIRVRAKVHTIGGLSAHAGQRDLLKWYEGFKQLPPVWLVHGEPQAQQALQAKLCDLHPGVPVNIASRGEVLKL